MVTENILSEEESSELVNDLYPSAKLAYWVLEKEGSEMRKTELKQETLLEDKTLREAIKTLEEEGVAYKRKDPHDNKKRIYGLNTEEFEIPHYTFLE